MITRYLFSITAHICYIFLVFFRMVFLVVFFGAKHGMFLLLVLLSLFGPGSCKVESPKKPETKLSNVEKSFPHPCCIKHTKFTLFGTGVPTKPFKSLPYKMYGGDPEKDLGIAAQTGIGGRGKQETASGRMETFFA